MTKRTAKPRPIDNRYLADPGSIRKAVAKALTDPDDLLDAEILERRRLQALVSADDSAQKDQDD
jgi:hypothetical protein